jgi:hypothetical protein
MEGGIIATGANGRAGDADGRAADLTGEGMATMVRVECGARGRLPAW